MDAIVLTTSIPKAYRKAVEQYNKSLQSEISKRCILSGCLVGSDLFGWGQAECEKYAKGLAEILHGYNEEIYRCRDNVGTIEEFADALDTELRERGIIIEFEE